MKRSTALGYLAAFTLGVICAAVILLVSDRRRPALAGPVDPPAPLVAVESETTPPEPPPRQTFQRMVRGPVAAPARVETQREEPMDGPPPEEQNVAIIGIPQVREVQRVVTVPLGSGAPRGSRGTAEDAGRISGKVRFLGEPPPEKSLPLDSTCSAKWEKAGMPPTTRIFLVGKDRGLADVVVSLLLEPRSGPRSGPMGVPFKIVQRNCWFEPYVSAIQAGQSVIVENRDAVLHNLHLTSEENGEYNRALLPGRDVKFTFKRPEESVRFKCDIHPWEFAYVAIYDHPYFTVSDRNGSFVIPDVPPGKYLVEARHRRAGTLQKEIKLEANRNLDVQFDFEPGSPPSIQREPLSSH